MPAGCRRYSVARDEHGDNEEREDGREMTDVLQGGADEPEELHAAGNDDGDGVR